MTVAVDPRSKNKIFEASSISEYFLKYTENLTAALNSISSKDLESVTQHIQRAVHADRRIYVAGNGGSASITDHLCCDWMKGTRTAGVKHLRAHSLVGNVALLTAFGNDHGYENCFSEQIDLLGEEGDILVLISSSGNSPNIVKAAEAARAKKMTCISFTGFSGGAVKDLSTVNIYVNFSNYGIVEDAHQAVMHSISQYLSLEAERTR